MDGTGVDPKYLRFNPAEWIILYSFYLVADHYHYCPIVCKVVVVQLCDKREDAAEVHRRQMIKTFHLIPGFSSDNISVISDIKWHGSFLLKQSWKTSCWWDTSFFSSQHHSFVSSLASNTSTLISEIHSEIEKYLLIA